MKSNGFMKGSLAALLGIMLLLTLTGAASAKSGPPAPGMVNTVRGPISVDKLGITLMHEHFTYAYPGWFADATIAPEDYKAALKKNLEAIKAAKAVGIRTIVDATPNDVGGRNPEFYKKLAKKTGINIICSTGLYSEHEGSPAYWKTRVMWGADISKMISELFIKEITEGIRDTGIKAGVIKCGTGGEMTPYEASVLKAAVMAQKATGVPIITHTDGPLGGVEQAELFIKEGANLKKVMIGHVSNSRDIEYHKAILAKGVYIGFDRIGLDIVTPLDVNARNVAELCKLGYANKIILSHDTVNFWLGRPIAVPDKALPLFTNWRMDTISLRFIPALKKLGVTDAQIKTMMVDNPRNLFLGK
jgi:phosphotriesterase-related protein